MEEPSMAELLAESLKRVAEKSKTKEEKESDAYREQMIKLTRWTDESAERLGSNIDRTCAVVIKSEDEYDEVVRNNQNIVCICRRQKSEWAHDDVAEVVAEEHEETIFLWIEAETTPGLVARLASLDALPCFVFVKNGKVVKRELVSEMSNAAASGNNGFMHWDLKNTLDQLGLINITEDERVAIDYYLDWPDRYWDIGEVEGTWDSEREEGEDYWY